MATPPPTPSKEGPWSVALTLLVLSVFALAVTHIVCSKFLHSDFFIQWMKNFGAIAEWFFTLILLKLGLPGLVGFIMYKLLTRK
jgi:hypothetical protein